MKDRAGLGEQMQRPNPTGLGMERRKSQGRHNGEKSPGGPGRQTTPLGKSGLGALGCLG